jgi:hypothetical protein
MIVKLDLNIQMSVSSTINIEGALFEIDMNIKRQSQIDLIR